MIFLLMISKLANFENLFLFLSFPGLSDLIFEVTELKIEA